MEFINFIKGYGKVNPNLEDQTTHQPKTTKKTLVTTFTISAILLLTLVLGLMLAALIHESNTEPPDDESSSSSSSFSSNSAELIKAVCNVTGYPASCFSSISSLNTPTQPDPESIFKLSLQVSIKELMSFSSKLKSFNDLNSKAALDDCVSLFEDAVTQVKDSLSAMEVGPGEKVLTVEKVKNIQTWISAAMTDQDTCLEGLEEMGSRVLDEVKAKVEKSKEFLSNSLAIVAHMQSLFEKFDLKMH